MPGPPDADRTAVDQPLTVTVSAVSADIAVCALKGDVDLATAPLLEKELAERTRVTPSHIVIDFSEVEFLGSAGLKTLTEFGAAQQDAGYHLAIVVKDNDAPARALHITGLSQILDLHTELSSAVDACRDHSGKPDSDT